MVWLIFAYILDTRREGLLTFKTNGSIIKCNQTTKIGYIVKYNCMLQEFSVMLEIISLIDWWLVISPKRNSYWNQTKVFVLNNNQRLVWKQLNWTRKINSARIADKSPIQLYKYLTAVWLFIYRDFVSACSFRHSLMLPPANGFSSIQRNSYVLVVFRTHQICSFSEPKTNATVGGFLSI